MNRHVYAFVVPGHTARDAAESFAAGYFPATRRIAEWRPGPDGSAEFTLQGGADVFHVRASGDGWLVRTANFPA